MSPSLLRCANGVAKVLSIKSSTPSGQTCGIEPEQAWWQIISHAIHLVTRSVSLIASSQNAQSPMSFRPAKLCKAWRDKRFDCVEFSSDLTGVEKEVAVGLILTVFSLLRGTFSCSALKFWRRAARLLSLDLPPILKIFLVLTAKLRTLLRLSLDPMRACVRYWRRVRKGSSEGYGRLC